MNDEMITLELPYPPTVNHYMKHTSRGHYLTDEARLFHQEVAIKVATMGMKKYWAGRIEMTMVVFPPDNRKRDISNLIKIVEDSLTRAGLWVDDFQVAKITVERSDTIPPHGGIMVTVKHSIGV